MDVSCYKLNERFRRCRDSPSGERRKKKKKDEQFDGLATFQFSLLQGLLTTVTLLLVVEADEYEG